MRRYPNPDGTLSLGDGDYGRDSDGAWLVRPPGQHAGSIPQHTVVEHEDGTISVSPSIKLNDENGEELWHGWLVKGEWEEA
jgi:hypothetical protein